MESINIAYESPQAAQYLSRLPAQRIANMARVCQLLRNNGMDDLMAQQPQQMQEMQQIGQQQIQQTPQNPHLQFHEFSPQRNHNVIGTHNPEAAPPHWVQNVPCQTAPPPPPQQQVPPQFAPSRFHNRTMMSSGSSLESYPYVLTNPQQQPSPGDKSQKQKRRRSMTSCLRRSESVGKGDVVADKENEFVRDRERKSKHRASFHGLCGQADVQGVVKPKVDNGPSQNTKQDLVMGKAILKLSVLCDHGILSVHVDKAKHLQSAGAPLCNSYVRVSLLPCTDNRVATATEIVHQTNHPSFDEKLSLKLTKDDNSKRVYVSVWHKRSDVDLCSEFLGSMSFGITNIVSQTRKVEGWYYLLQEDIGCRKHLQAILKKA